MVFRRLRCLGTRHPKHEAASIGVSQPPPPQTRTPCGELGLGLRDTSVVGGSGPAVGGRSGSPRPARAPARSSGAELREGAVPVPRGAWSAAASSPAPEGGRCAVHSRPQRGARPVCHAVAAPGGGGPLPMSPSLPTGREGPRRRETRTPGFSRRWLRPPLAAWLSQRGPRCPPWSPSHVAHAAS